MDTYLLSSMAHVDPATPPPTTRNPPSIARTRDCHRMILTCSSKVESSENDANSTHVVLGIVSGTKTLNGKRADMRWPRACLLGRKVNVSRLGLSGREYI